MNRSDLMEQLMAHSGLTRKESSWVVRRFFEAIAKGLAEDGRVELRGFGVFRVSHRRQAGFLNPKDGQYYGGLDLKTIRFYPSSNLEKDGF